MVQHIFHGGCHNCTQQEINGVDFCIKCQYFNANWDLPNLNNYISDTEQIKTNLKIKHNIELNERDEFIIGENRCKKEQVEEEDSEKILSSLPAIISSEISSDNNLNSFNITRYMLYKFLFIFCLTLVILITIHNE